jgi:hypothetical protein
MAGVAVAVTAFAQRPHPKSVDAIIPGYWDTATNTFVAQIPLKLPVKTPADPEADAVQTTKYTGTVKFSMTITLLAPVPPGFDVLCEGYFQTGDGDPGTSEVGNESVATVSGSHATCSVLVPYSLSLASESNLISPSYSLTLEPIANSTIPANYMYRTFSGELPTIGFPSNGTLTDLKVEASF